MKRYFALILVLVLCLSLCACGNKTLTLEDLSDMYVQDDDTRASFEFEDGTMTVEIIKYVESSLSPTGKLGVPQDTFTKSYTLNGDNYVIVDGKEYYYEILEESGKVKFSVKFMDLARSFEFGYVK